MRGTGGKGYSCFILDAQLQYLKGRDLRRQLQTLGMRGLCSHGDVSSLSAEDPDSVDKGVDRVLLCQVSYCRLAHQRGACLVRRPGWHKVWPWMV